MLIKLEDVVDLPTEPYHPQCIQQLVVQCKAQRCYESQSRQLKNEGAKNFSALHADDRRLRASTHCLRQWPYHSKNASYRPAKWNAIGSSQLDSCADRDADAVLDVPLIFQLH